MSGVSLGVFFLGACIGFQLKSQDIGMDPQGLGRVAVHSQNFLEVTFYLTLQMSTEHRFIEGRS